MKTLPDKSVDCFVCDLPYGQLSKGGCSWDVGLNLEHFWTQVKRLAKDDHTPVLMFCNTKFGYELIKSNESWFRYDLVWDKERGVSFLSVNKMPMKSHEMIYVFSKTGAYYNRIDIKSDKPGWKAMKASNKNPQHGIRVYSTITGGWKANENNGTRSVLSVIRMSRVTKRSDHPTAKPTDLYRWLLERYCPEGGTMLDPTAGSFNSVKVGKELGLNAIGIEKDDGFFATAKKALEPEETTQPPMNEVIFTPITP